ncbi:hypothetical protein C8F01DRAFT_1115166 [Mycena amicta]|nr:hypothetical protein C8F01DRAFT_1197606 [Mycena amicta]KAJ7055269.1 hypothetical protein C8F01DRAFT_1159961 [Mycena amicta]KAJ7055284.1 hypothetical protein C8F01DRAFT_1160019 [Mycena amicta]KAJ7056316.1 hypothetical protein C8F01DRAFT_1155629 [Mycena amicta]KAJ7057369.1 hypothetical protein C8F01DRAFT_1151835 [Mycena amicta]
MSLMRLARLIELPRVRAFFSSLLSLALSFLLENCVLRCVGLLPVAYLLTTCLTSATPHSHLPHSHLPFRCAPILCPPMSPPATHAVVAPAGLSTSHLWCRSICADRDIFPVR